MTRRHGEAARRGGMVKAACCCSPNHHRVTDRVGDDLHVLELLLERGHSCRDLLDIHRLQRLPQSLNHALHALRNLLRLDRGFLRSGGRWAVGGLWAVCGRRWAAVGNRPVAVIPGSRVTNLAATASILLLSLR